MNALMHTKIDKITFGTQMLKRDLYLLELGSMAPERISQEMVVEQSVGEVLQLQFDVASLMAGCLYAGFRQPMGQAYQIFEKLWGVFASLDVMYSTLTAPNRQNNGKRLHPAELKQLELVWITLNRLTRQAREQLEDGELLSAGKRYEAVH